MIEADHQSDIRRKLDPLRPPGGFTPRATRRCCSPTSVMDVEADKTWHGKGWLFLGCSGGCRGKRIYDDIQRRRWKQIVAASTAAFARIGTGRRCAALRPGGFP